MHGGADLAVESMLATHQGELIDDLVPRFWAGLKDNIVKGGHGDDAAALEHQLAAKFKALCDAVHRQQGQLHSLIQHLRPGNATGSRAPVYGTAAVQSRYTQAVVVHMTTGAVEGRLPELLDCCLAHRLQQFDDGSPVQLILEDPEDQEEVDPSAAAASVAQVCGAEAVAGLHHIADALRVLGLAHVMHAAAGATVKAHTTQRLAGFGAGEFLAMALPPAMNWAVAVPARFLQDVLCDDQAVAQRWVAALAGLAGRLIARQRIEDMFSIIRDFPDSRPAVLDLQIGLATEPALQHHFVSTLRAATRKRLLQAGAATDDIIEQYVLTIRTLRAVDPSGVLLEAVSGAIRAYLRDRRDAVRCIVKMLTDDSSDEAGDTLFEELARTGEHVEDVSDAEMDDDEAALAGAASWHPDPATADPTTSARQRRTGDIINALVGIYGSKDLFMNEYRLMLAEKLLAKTNFDCSRELRTMELLKLRFGDGNMHNAEIMLVDLANSKRVATVVHANRPELSDLKATIVSELFWPPFHGDDVKLPLEVTGDAKRKLDAFAAEYHRLKTPRNLVWKSALGSVLLTIQAGTTTAELRVSPAQAAIITQFSDRKQWLLTDLAAHLTLQEPALRRILVFWTSQGYLREWRDAEGAAMVGRVEDRRSEAVKAPVEDEDLPGAAASLRADEEQAAQEVENLSKYILVMVSNFAGGKALPDIHNMLKMFFKQPPYDKSLDELAAILARLVSQERLVNTGGLYSVRRQ